MKKTLLCGALLAVFAAPCAEARITRIEIDPVLSQSPTFGGFSWPGVGQYERIIGRAFGELNPHDRKNSIIVDIGHAPTNARGNVEYSFDFYILKPIDLTKGSDKMMYEPPNRGGKTWAALGRMPNGNDPGGTVTEYGYDLNEKLVEVRRQGRVRETYRRDKAGNEQEEQPQDPGRPRVVLRKGRRRRVLEIGNVGRDVRLLELRQAEIRAAAVERLQAFLAGEDKRRRGRVEGA